MLPVWLVRGCPSFDTSKARACRCVKVRKRFRGRRKCDTRTQGNRAWCAAAGMVRRSSNVRECCTRCADVTHTCGVAAQGVYAPVTWRAMQSTAARCVGCIGRVCVGRMCTREALCHMDTSCAHMGTQGPQRPGGRMTTRVAAAHAAQSSPLRQSSESQKKFKAEACGPSTPPPPPTAVLHVQAQL